MGMLKGAESEMLQKKREHDANKVVKGASTLEKNLEGEKYDTITGYCTFIYT